MRSSYCKDYSEFCGSFIQNSHLLFFSIYHPFFFISLSLQNTNLCALYCLQMFLDPFEEMNIAEKTAEQHRRSAGETEV